MLSELDGDAIRRWICECADVLEQHREEIDALNVYPIPDADTGTNLSRTLRGASTALCSSPGSPTGLADDVTAGAALAAAAQAAVLNARGNSGVIVAQMLTGMAESVTGMPSIDGVGLTRALQSGDTAGWTCVGRPVEGTVLSVMRAAAGAAARSDGTLTAVAASAAACAIQALDRTPQQLPTLAAAGVVDAGGYGLVLMLQALHDLARDDAERTRHHPARAVELAANQAPAAGADPDEVDGHEVGGDDVDGADVRDLTPADLSSDAGSAVYSFEVQYLLDAPEGEVDRLRHRLNRLGDSLVIARAEVGRYHVHVHTDDVGAVIEAGIEVGRPRSIRVTGLADDGGHAGARAGDPRPVAVQRSIGTALICVAAETASAALFGSAAVVLAEDGEASNAARLLGVEIARTCAANVIVLPNSAAALGWAEAAAQEARAKGIAVAVIPTRSVVQGLAGLAVHDAHRPFQDDVVAVAEAAAATRVAEVSVAEAESMTYAGRCQAGDILGLIDGEVVEIGSSTAEVGTRLVRRLVDGGGELVTILVGPDGATAASIIRRYLHETYPTVDVAVLPGAQTQARLLIGVE